MEEKGIRLGRILYPVTALGPGNRLGIWLQGCDRRCEGCANPELQTHEKDTIPTEMAIGMVKSAVKNYRLEGITISGGEPLLQAEELCVLLDAVKPLCNDVLLFTGFTMEEIKRENNPAVLSLLKNVSVLVDGPYIKTKNKGEILRGSENQVIHFLDENLREKYEQYIAKNRHITNTFAADGGVVAVGIHPEGILR